MQDSVRNMILEVPLAGHILVCWFHLDTDLGRVCSRTLNIDYSARIRVQKHGRVVERLKTRAILSLSAV